MPAQAVPPLPPWWVTASPFRARKESEGTLVLQEKGSRAEMESQVCQVFRGRRVPGETRETLVLQESGFQDLRVMKDPGDSQDFLGLLVRVDCPALLAPKGKRDLEVILDVPDHRGHRVLERQDPRVKTALPALRGSRDLRAYPDLMELKGTRVHLESATAWRRCTQVSEDQELQELQ